MPHEKQKRAKKNGESVKKAGFIILVLLSEHAERVRGSSVRDFFSKDVEIACSHGLSVRGKEYLPRREYSPIEYILNIKKSQYGTKP